MRSLNGVAEKYDFGGNWAVGPNLNIIDNSILIVDNENLFTYLGWLVISRVIHQKPPNFEVFWS